MRILHLLNNINESGNGITNVAVDLATHQAGLGHQVTVGSAGGSYAPLLTEADVALRRLDFNRRQPLPLMRARAELASVVRALRPDVVHTHTLTPTVVARSVPGLRLVATVHNEYQRGAWVMGTADRVVGVSHAVSEAMLRRHVRRARVRTVLNGVVGTPRRTDQPIAAEVTSPAVVAVGAISRRKGSDVLAAAFARVLESVPQAHLYFVGDRNWPELEAGLADHPLTRGRIHFVGFLAQPQGFLAAADVFVLPSRRDPFPLVLLEAMEAGCAIVASDVDGIPEALDRGRAGLLAAVGDPVDLAAKITSLLQHPELADSYADRARRAAQRYSVARMNEDYLQIYRELCA